MTIYLGRQLPGASSDLPGQLASSLIPSLFGLAAGGVYQANQSPGFWCALTAPFHPCQAHARWFVFCGTFLRVSPTGRYPAPCSTQLGLSSDVTFRFYIRGHLVSSHFECLLSPQSAVSSTNDLWLACHNLPRSSSIAFTAKRSAISLY